MKKMFYTAFTMTALAVMMSANAQAANPKRGGVCIGPFRGGDSAFSCEIIGKVTIRQIYEKGFRVVHMQDDKDTATYAILVIEEQ